MSNQWSDIEKSWYDWVDKKDVKDATKQKYKRQIKTKLTELQQQSAGKQALQQMVLNDVHKIETMTQLTEYKVSEDNYEDPFIKAFLTEQASIEEALNNIPHITNEQVLQYQDTNVNGLIQTAPEISHLVEKVKIYGVQLDNGKFVRIGDLLNKEDDAVLQRHLEQVVELTMVNNNLTTSQTIDVHSIHTFIDGIFISSKPITIQELVKLYLKKLKEGQNEYYIEELKNYSNCIEITRLIKYKTGKHYEEDKEFESIMKTTIQLVKNTDDRCLYAALFIALVLKSRLNDSTYAVQSFAAKFSKDCFNRELSKYENNTKKNLYHYTNELMIKLDGIDQDLSQETIINGHRFLRRSTSVNIVVCGSHKLLQK